MENNQKEQIKQITDFLKKNRYRIVVMLLLLFPIIYFESRFVMERENGWLEQRYISCRVKVTYKDSTSVFIDLIKDDSLIETNNLIRDVREEFAFVNTQLGIIANFSKIELVFYVDNQLYSQYEQIQGNFYIEDKSGVIRKYDFEKSKEGFPFFIATRDISNIMNKEAVPQEIRTNVRFTNG